MAPPFRVKPRSPSASATTADTAGDTAPGVVGLAELGLRPSEKVRFRRRANERWKPGTVVRRERDGSVGLHDAKGAARALPVDCIEVTATGRRGGVLWEPLAERVARQEQMRLL